MHTHAQLRASSVIRLVRPHTKHGQPSCVNGRTAYFVGSNIISVEAHEKFRASCVLLTVHEMLMGTHVAHHGHVCTACVHPGAHMRCVRRGGGRVHVCTLMRMWVRIAYCASARYVCGHALCTPTREETATTPYTESVEGYFATGLT